MEPMGTAEEFVRLMWQKYLVDRDYGIFGSGILDERLSVIGTGAHEFSRNLEEFASSIAQECREWDGSFLIKDQWYQTTVLSDEISLVIGEITAKEHANDGFLFDLYFRFTAVLRKDGDSWKAIHVHQSVPDPNQANDEFFPHHMVEKNDQQVIFNLRHDHMTGLFNRLYLSEIVDRSMRGRPDGLMIMVDVDKFKQLNDTYGHPFGDKVLILLAQSLKSAFSKGIIGRVGGDEFVVYLPGQALPACERQLKAFKEDWNAAQQGLQLPYRVSVSAGISRCPAHGVTYVDVWRKADEALYAAKRSGEDQVYVLHT